VADKGWISQLRPLSWRLCRRVSILLQKSNIVSAVQATVSITCTPDTKQETLSDAFPSIVVTLIMLFFSKPNATFSSLGQDSEDDAERDGMLEKNEYAGGKATPKSRRFWSSNVPWMCSTLVLSVYIIANSLYQRKTPDLWSPTDLSNSSLFLISTPAYGLGPARPYLEESMKTFTAGLDYNNANKTLQHTPSPGPKFVGLPSREIDALWKDIAGSKSSQLRSQLRLLTFHSTGDLLNERRGNRRKGGSYIS
jgi:hypothetical protein